MIKIISHIAGLSALYVAFQESQPTGSNPLFLFISSNKAVTFVGLVLAMLLILASFKTKFNRFSSYFACWAAAIGLCSMAVAGVVLPQFYNGLYGYLLPLDYLFALGLGIGFSICALSLPHPDFSWPPLIRQITVMKQIARADILMTPSALRFRLLLARSY